MTAVTGPVIAPKEGIFGQISNSIPARPSAKDLTTIQYSKLLQADRLQRAQRLDRGTSWLTHPGCGEAVFRCYDTIKAGLYLGVGALRLSYSLRLSFEDDLTATGWIRRFLALNVPYVTQRSDVPVLIARLWPLVVPPFPALTTSSQASPHRTLLPTDTGFLSPA